MNITFLGQGLENDYETTVFSVLKDSLEDERFNQAHWLSAFVSRSALESLSREITAFSERGQIRIFAGIDNKATPADALRELLSFGFDSYVVHWQNNTIFHPKLYLFWGAENTRVVIGSSNLTEPGLSNNLENSALIDFSNNDQEAQEFIGRIRQFYGTIFDLSHSNVHVLSEQLIDELVNSGIVPETIVYERAPSNSPAADNQSVVDRIKELFPKIPRRLFRGYRRPRQRPQVPPEEPSGVTTAPARPLAPLSDDLSESGLLWTKVNLPASDVEFTGPGTNPTGRLKLVQAGHDIDRTTYFRYDVFRELSWRRRGGDGDDRDKEDTTANFQIILLGEDKGVHSLGITHNPRGDSDQNNYTTSISWSGVSAMIRENDLRRKTLRLFHSTNPGKDFVLIIE